MSQDPPNNPPPGRVTGQDSAPSEDSISNLERQQQITQQVAESRTLSNEQLREQAKLLEEINVKLGQGFEAQKNIFAQYQVGITQFIDDFDKAVEKAKKGNLEAIDELVNGARKRFESQFKESSAVTEKIIKLAAAQDIAGLEKFKAELNTAKGASEKFNAGLTGLTSKMGLAAKFSDTLAGSVLEQAMTLKTLSKEARNEAITGMAASFQQATSAGVILTAILGKLMNTAMEAFDSMNQLTNTFGTDEFAGSVTSAYEETAKFGGTLKETGAILNAMGKEFSEFNFLNDDMKDSIAANSLTLERLGISATTSGKMLNPLVKGLGMTADAASDLQVSIAASAKGFGKSSEQMVQDFSTAMESIIYAGEGAIKIFEDIAGEAARTGIAVNKLMTITGAFDKFSGAADKAATLNALFGTSLSAMGMHAMDEGQRLEELKKQFQAAGMSADSLDKYQLKALAETLGVTMPEAMQMLGGELSEQQKEQMKMAEASEELNQTMGRLTLKAMPLIKQLEAMFNQIFANEETINAFVYGIKQVAFFISAMMQHIKTAVTGGLFILLGAKLIAMVVPAYLAAGSFEAMGVASKRAMTGGLTLLILGILALGAALVMARSPKFYLLLGIVALGIFAIGQAAQVSQSGLYAVGFAALAMGAGLSLVFFGLSMVIDAFTNMIVKTAEFADVIPIITLSVIGLAAGLYLLGASGIVGMTGMLMAAVGLFAILAAFTLTGQSVGDFIKGGGDEIAKLGAGIAGFGEGMEKLMTVAGKIKSVMGDSLMVASMQGDKMSLVVGKGGGVATLFKNDTLNIKVDMPTIKMPKPEFQIFIDKKEIVAIVKEVDSDSRR